MKSSENPVSGQSNSWGGMRLWVVTALALTLVMVLLKHNFFEQKESWETLPINDFKGFDNSSLKSLAI